MMNFSKECYLQIKISEQDKSSLILKKAQKELQEYFNNIFYTELERTKPIVIQFVVQKSDELKYDGFFIDIAQSGITIASGMERGILHGVYAFLKLLGCHFIFPKKEFEVVPLQEQMELENQKHIHNPLIEFRGMCLYQTMRSTLQETLETVDFMAKNYYNLLLTSLERQDDTIADCHAILYREIEKELLPELKERGIIIDMSEHSTDCFFPRDELYKKHPEWFSLIDGKRIPGQICYSNYEAVQEYTKAFVSFVKQHNEFEILGTWPLDGGGYCQCDKCQDPLLLYTVNKQIAAEIKKVRPELIVEHLAYTPQSFTRPRDPLPENMSVLVCSVKNEVAYEWGLKAEKSGGAFYFDYCTGDNYRYRANLFINPFYISSMVNNFATYRYRGIISLFLPITAWWQAGINYSLLSESYYDPLQLAEVQLERICLGLFGKENSAIMTKAMCRTVSELQSKLLWSGHPHKHTYMPQHTDNRIKEVDQMHLLHFEKVYQEIIELLKTVSHEKFTPPQRLQYRYFLAYLELQKIYFTDIDQFNSKTQTQKQADRYIQKLSDLKNEYGPVFIDPDYARWRIIGRDNILKSTSAQNAYQPQIELHPKS